MSFPRIHPVVLSVALLAAMPAQPALAAQAAQPAPSQLPPPAPIFDLGTIVVIGAPIGVPGVGGAVLTQAEMSRFDRQTLDKAVNLIPGVSSTFDANGRRNESDVFVRGFGRWQVPLMLDGVRVYLPADNRLDFGRFLTADVAAVQVQKGYASVLDGPGAMGGAINLVTRKPTKPLEFQATLSASGREDMEGWSGYGLIGTRQTRYYLQGSVNFVDRDFWTLSSEYTPTANSLQPAGRRLSSDSADWRVNAKAGFTPNSTDEYTINVTRQSGEKGAPLNVRNNPPVPPNSYWRWPYWDITNTSFLSRTQVGASAQVKTKLYYNTFKNGLDAFDDGTYTTQSANGRFRSPYDDHAYGGSVELGTSLAGRHQARIAVHYRADVHTEQQESRPTHPTLHTIEPVQKQSQYTWSVAAEDIIRVSSTVDLVAGASVDRYAITKAEEFNTTRGIFEYPRGGSDAFNWQAAAIWRAHAMATLHASVSDRSRFPVIFELYSTRFGTATPNPDLGPERATNFEIGWKSDPSRRVIAEAAVFYSDVRKLIQTVVLPDTTTQTQNVGNGEFYGGEISVTAHLGEQVTIGGNYTALRRTVTDALQPNLRPTGVPTHKAFLHASWQPVTRLSFIASADLAGDRWSDVNPAPAFPYVRTGAYTLVNLGAEISLSPKAALSFGFKNLMDDYYELAWGFPQPGRTFSVKTTISY